MVRVASALLQVCEALGLLPGSENAVKRPQRWDLRICRMVKTTPNAQHCPSPALGGLFWCRGARCEAVPAAGNTPNYPKLPQGLLGGARCCSITALYFFNFPPLGSGVSHEQRARGERCPQPRGARRRARSQLWQPLFGTRQSPRRHRREVSEQPPREDLFFGGASEPER